MRQNLRERTPTREVPVFEILTLGQDALKFTSDGGKEDRWIGMSDAEIIQFCRTEEA